MKKKKKALKQMVRDLDREVEDLLDREHRMSNGFTTRQIELVDARNAALRRVAVLELQCKMTTPVLHEAAERVKQSDAVLAAHWANVGAFVERARRIEKTATHLRETLSQSGKTDAEAGTVTYTLDEILGAARSFDAAVARVAEAPASPPVTLLQQLQGARCVEVVPAAAPAVDVHEQDGGWR